MAALLRAAKSIMSLKFHWMLPKGGEVKLDGRQTPLEAARYRIESMSHRFAGAQAGSERLDALRATG